jgi:hypothetical protein
MASLTHAATGRLDATTTDTVVNCSLVVLIMTVIPLAACVAYVRDTSRRSMAASGVTVTRGSSSR